MKFLRSIIKERLSTIEYNAMACLGGIRQNEKTFSDMKNMYADKEIVLCGAGPTLEKYMPMEDKIHVALNRAILKQGIKFDIFIADDWLGISFIQNEIIGFDGLKLLGTSFRRPYKSQIPESFFIESKARKYYTDGHLLTSNNHGRLVCDIDKFLIGNMDNMALQSLQILLYTNPKKIYLVGCDCSEGHFVYCPGHEEKILMKSSVDIKKTRGEWEKFVDFKNCFYPNIEIVSINPVGLRGLFKDEYY